VYTKKDMEDLFEKQPKNADRDFTKDRNKKSKKTEARAVPEDMETIEL